VSDPPFAVDAPVAIALTPRPDILPLTPAREAALRVAVVAEATSWVGTPYRQLGATKGIAVDCSMHVALTLIEAGVFEPFDPRPYPPLWFLHREDERYLDWLQATADVVAVPQPGDVISVKFGRAYAHSGIVISDSQLVHAFAETGVVQISPLTHPLLTFADRTGTRLRPRLYFDYLARIRSNSAIA
jgi:cell wall-associated NlpC family hydrolase